MIDLVSSGKLFLTVSFVLSVAFFFFFLMIRRPPRSTQSRSSAASDVYKRQRLKDAVESIKVELTDRRGFLEREGRLLEAQRLHQRTMFDLEMIKEIGYCHGIENYSRHLTGRLPGQPPPTLLDYLPSDALVIVDESHQTIPQVRGMYHGDRSRKEALVEYGFRLPSALDNRPLNFDEWEARVPQLIYVSDTPGPYALKRAGGVVVEQVIRPTGLTDPPITVRPVKGQVDDLLGEIRIRAENSRSTRRSCLALNHFAICGWEEVIQPWMLDFGCTLTCPNQVRWQGFAA